ncbi:MAG: hypothetical protein Q7S60_03625 [bacterium]|nr:hypothetical protein [bacterium]
MSLLAIDIGEKFSPPPYLKETKGVGTLVSLILSNALILAGILLLISIIIGGLALIQGAGSGDPEKGAQGKKAATASFIGFLIIFSAYWIIKLIELVTGISILS